MLEAPYKASNGKNLKTRSVDNQAVKERRRSLRSCLGRTYQSQALEWYCAQASLYMAIAGAMTSKYCVPKR